MNRDHTLFHLREAREELNITITEIEQDAEYDYPDLVVAMNHLYHHLNTAWNGRDATPEAHEDCSEENFNSWRKFPCNAELLLE